MKVFFGATAVVFLLLAPAAVASEHGDVVFSANLARKKVVERHGVRAAGRDIVKWGIVSHGSSRPATLSELRRYRTQLYRIIRPPARPAMTKYVGPPTQAPAGTQSSYGVPPASIAQCESGGDPTAVSAGGTYRGKWQFDYQTWNAYGGSGDPAAASEAEQDRIAGKLYAARGSAPWPVCG
jgi:hypothetical protein